MSNVYTDAQKIAMLVRSIDGVKKAIQEQNKELHEQNRILRAFYENQYVSTKDKRMAEETQLSLFDFDNNMMEV